MRLIPSDFGVGIRTLLNKARESFRAHNTRLRLLRIAVAIIAGVVLVSLTVISGFFTRSVASQGAFEPRGDGYSVKGDVWIKQDGHLVDGLKRGGSYQETDFENPEDDTSFGNDNAPEAHRANDANYRKELFLTGKLSGDTTAINTKVTLLGNYSFNQPRYFANINIDNEGQNRSILQMEPNTLPIDTFAMRWIGYITVPDGGKIETWTDPNVNRVRVRIYSPTNDDTLYCGSGISDESDCSSGNRGDGTIWNNNYKRLISINGGPNSTDTYKIVIDYANKKNVEGKHFYIRMRNQSNNQLNTKGNIRFQRNDPGLGINVNYFEKEWTDPNPPSGGVYLPENYAFRNGESLQIVGGNQISNYVENEAFADPRSIARPSKFPAVVQKMKLNITNSLVLRRGRIDVSGQGLPINPNSYFANNGSTQGGYGPYTDKEECTDNGSLRTNRNGSGGGGGIPGGDNGGGGGGHGGEGGWGGHDEGNDWGPAGAANDRLIEPQCPGASGAYYNGGAGGGYVWIKAKTIKHGFVIRDEAGVIRADGQGANTTGSYGVSKGGGGAGGSIVANVETVDASGFDINNNTYKIYTARGGNGGDDNAEPSGSGGGGRISIRASDLILFDNQNNNDRNALLNQYDTLMKNNMSVNPGQPNPNSRNDLKYFFSGKIGTIWLVDKNLGAGGGGGSGTTMSKTITNGGVTRNRGETVDFQLSLYFPSAPGQSITVTDTLPATVFEDPSNFTYSSNLIGCNPARGGDTITITCTGAGQGNATIKYSAKVK